MIAAFFTHSLLFAGFVFFPISVIEAAQIDGAGEWQIFRRICLPLCKGCLCSVAILVFIDYWNMVEQPLILLSDDTMHPLSVFLSKIKNGEIGLAFAVATIYMIPTLLVFLYGEDYLVEGIQMRRNICHSPAPSIWAASITEIGILRMNFVSKYTAKGENIPGSHIAHLVSSR